MFGIVLKIAVTGVAGIGAQWAAWRLRIPAIALLLAAGLVLGPLTGYLNPQQTFGDLYRPVISLSVAIILFEGGLTLNFKEIKETSTALRRIILISGPLVWIMTALAAHYVAGLSWPSSIILGAILVVTGPTVIMPLLRQAHLSPRPASLLRWEAIINDPIGALFAVLSFETYLVLKDAHSGFHLIWMALLAGIVAVGGGFVLGKAIVLAFTSGRVPEFLKAPILLVSVLFAYAFSDLLLEEAGLLTVTVLGITLANSRMASLTELRRFKETVTILLVSGLFIILTASLDVSALQSLGWGTVFFVALLLVVVRPIAIFAATIGTGLELNERILVSWIAPRGIVAVAVSGLFGTALVDLGVADGGQLTALTFAVVATTIILHGFTLGPLAGLLGLKSSEKPGLLIIGGSTWADALAAKLQENEIPVLIADANWNHIQAARLNSIPVYYGDVLSEAVHHDIVLNRYSHLLAATDNDAYNSLVCTEFGPDIGRSSVFQIGKVREDNERQNLSFTLGGRSPFKPARDFMELRSAMWQGWVFQSTRLTDEFDYQAYLASRSPDTSLILWIKPNGNIMFREGRHNAEPTKGDLLFAFGPPLSDDEKLNKSADSEAN